MTETVYFTRGRSGGAAGFAREPLEQPGLAKLKITVNGCPGNTEMLSGFVVRTTQEKAELDDSYFSLVNGFQVVECGIESQHLLAGGVDPGHLLMQRHSHSRIRTLEGSVFAGIVDQNHPHH